MKTELLYFKVKGDRVPAGVVPLVGANLVCPPLETSKKPVSVPVVMSVPVVISEWA